MSKFHHRGILLLLLLLPVITKAASSTFVVPVSDIETYLKNGKVPDNSDFPFPKFLSSTFVMSVSPMNRILELREVHSFENDMKYFYNQIFDSQTKYDLTVRSVGVMDQIISNEGQMLEMEITVDVNFRPKPEDQEITQTEFDNVVLNLVNKFETELINYFKSQHNDFGKIDSLEAWNETTPESLPAKPIGLYVMITITIVLFITGLIFCCFLSRREIHHLPKYIPACVGNLSAFRNYDRFPTKDVILEDGESITPQSSPYSTRTESTHLEAKRSISHEIDVPPPTAFDLFNREKERLTLDVPQKPLTIPGTRIELWAPAGKLGVAIDVVDGRPIVWRLKPGSPLEGFLEKGDIIVAIDEIDTSQMSAADVTSVMVRRMRQRRKIAYIRSSGRKSSNNDADVR